MHGHPHGPNALPVHPGNPNVNVDPRVDGRLPVPGRAPGSGAKTNPSEWTTKPGYQTRKPKDLNSKGNHSDWAAQESYAQISGIPADPNMYFSYPDLESYWSAEEGEVPEPYVAAAYVKWFVSSWEKAYDKRGRSQLDDSVTLDDIAAAIQRRDPSMLEVLSQCATDHHNVAEISRDSYARPLSEGKYDSEGKKNKNTSTVPFAVQHLVEIIPNTRADKNLSDRAGIINTKRLVANSHAAGAGSSLQPTNPLRSKNIRESRSKHNPDEVIHHVVEELDALSSEFAKLAFRNGKELSRVVAKAVKQNVPDDYSGLPDYVGSPALADTNYRRVQHQHTVNIAGSEVSVYIDPAHGRILDSIGTTLVQYDGDRTILCLGAGNEIVLDEPLSYDEAMVERVRFTELLVTGGRIALSTEVSTENSEQFSFSYSDLETRQPVLSRLNPIVLDYTNQNEVIRPHQTINLSNGVILKKFQDGTIRLADDTIVAREIKVGAEEDVYTQIFSEGNPIVSEGPKDPVEIYKNFMLLNPVLAAGQNLNETWRIKQVTAPGNNGEAFPPPTQADIHASKLGLNNGNIRVRMLDGGPDIPDGKLVNYTYSDPNNPGSIHYLVEFTGRDGTKQQTWISPEKLRFWNPPKPQP